MAARPSSGTTRAVTAGAGQVRRGRYFMFRLLISILVAGLVLGGCDTSRNNRFTNTNDRAGEEAVWGRIDCQRGEGNTELQRQFDEARAVCVARGAAVAENSPCMSAQGYVFRTKAEHVSACQQQKRNPVTRQ